MDIGLQITTTKKGLKIDPRSKIMILIAVGIIMMSGKLTGVEYILRIICTFVPFVLLLSVKQIKTAFGYLFILLCVELCEGFIVPKTHGVMNLVIMIICGIISRFGPSYLCGWYVVKSTSVSEFVTAMDKMHFPKIITIPMSVMFRYFPTLKEDYSSIHDAMKMRGVGKTVKNPFVIIEYILVPIMMSTVQIANDLSAASLTKGLGATKNRTHVCDVKIKAFDVILITALTSMLVIFFIF